MCEIYMGLNAYIREEGLINTSPVVIMPHECNHWLRSHYQTRFLTVVLPPIDPDDLRLLISYMYRPVRKGPLNRDEAWPDIEYKATTEESYDGRAYDPLLDPPDEPPQFLKRYFMPANQRFDQWGQPLDDPPFLKGGYFKPLPVVDSPIDSQVEPLFGFFHGQPYANHWLQPPVGPGYENPIHQLYMRRWGIELAIPGVNIPTEAELRRQAQTLEALQLDMLSKLGIPDDREQREQ